MAQSDNGWFEREQLHFAAGDGDLARVKDLVEKGYDVNAFDEDLSFTPLHYAARENHIEIVKYLLAAGADVNAHEEGKIGDRQQGEGKKVFELLVKAAKEKYHSRP